MAAKRASLPKVGEFVLFCQAWNRPKKWFPFLVTDVHKGDGTISGVGFTGLPGEVAWNNRGVMAFGHVARGTAHNEWKPIPAGAKPKKSDNGDNGDGGDGSDGDGGDGSDGDGGDGEGPFTDTGNGGDGGGDS